ncbi:hypothetical protein OKW29_004570 [Paraburkholderia sp. CI3]
MDFGIYRANLTQNLGGVGSAWPPPKLPASCNEREERYRRPRPSSRRQTRAKCFFSLALAVWSTSLSFTCPLCGSRVVRGRQRGPSRSLSIPTERCARRARNSIARRPSRIACGWVPRCSMPEMPPKPWSITDRRPMGRSHRIRLYSKGWRARSLPTAMLRPRRHAGKTVRRSSPRPPATRACLAVCTALATICAPGTRAAVETALTSASDAAPRRLYADWLTAQPDDADRQRARELFVHDAKHWPCHARDHNSEWLQRAQAALSR